MIHRQDIIEYFAGKSKYVPTIRKLDPWSFTVFTPKDTPEWWWSKYAGSMILHLRGMPYAELGVMIDRSPKTAQRWVERGMEIAQKEIGKEFDVRKTP